MAITYLWLGARSIPNRIISRRGGISWNTENQEGYSEEEEKTRRIPEKTTRKTQAREGNPDENEDEGENENENENENNGNQN